MKKFSIIVNADHIPGISETSFKTGINYSIDECGLIIHDAKDEICNCIDYILGKNQSHGTHLEALEHLGAVTYLKQSTAIDSIQLSESDDGTIEVVLVFTNTTLKKEWFDTGFSILMALNLAGHSLVTGTFIYDELEFLAYIKNKKLQLSYIGVNGLDPLTESPQKEEKPKSKFVLE
jgi:hypothetical protein